MIFLRKRKCGPWFVELASCAGNKLYLDPFNITTLVKSGLIDLGNSKCVLCNLILKAGTLLIYKSIKIVCYWVFSTQENIKTLYCI